MAELRLFKGSIGPPVEQVWSKWWMSERLLIRTVDVRSLTAMENDREEEFTYFIIH